MGIDKVLSKFIFALILINTPCSALVILLITDGHISAVFLPLFSSLVFAQFFTLFAVQLMAAMVTNKFHASTNRLIFLNITKTWNLSFITLLKLTHYICKLNTTNYYGISYNLIKIITIDDFAKVFYIL